MEIFKRNPATGVGPGNFIPYRMKQVDGVKLNPHNLVGQMLAETGLLGTAAFAIMVVSILVNCRKSVAASERNPDTNCQVLSGLARACRNSVILLFVEGISGHNFYRFNWLWLGAFCSLAAGFAMQIRSSSEYDDEEPQMENESARNYSQLV